MPGLPLRKKALRAEVLALRQTKGVYVCGACGAVIPLGFGHRREHGRNSGCTVVHREVA